MHQFFLLPLVAAAIQSKSRVKIWLYEDTRMALEGQIIGFDEYMNMTLDDAVELDTKSGKRRDIGRILLKGDNITLIQDANPRPPAMDVME
jgi:small nuclear ribonucleoprotein E